MKNGVIVTVNKFGVVQTHSFIEIFCLAAFLAISFGVIIYIILYLENNK